jgi:rubrerythrin
MADVTANKYSFRALGNMGRLDVDALASLYTIELGGEDFYNALAERVRNPAAAALLRSNGREEAGHARRVARAIAIKLGRDFDPTPEMLERRPVRLPDDLDSATFPQLIEGERQGDLGYQRWADNEPDPQVQRLLRLNGREESIHAGRVERVITLIDGA